MHGVLLTDSRSSLTCIIFIHYAVLAVLGTCVQNVFTVCYPLSAKYVSKWS